MLTLSTTATVWLSMTFAAADPPAKPQDTAARVAVAADSMRNLEQAVIANRQRIWGADVTLQTKGYSEIEHFDFTLDLRFDRQYARIVLRPEQVDQIGKHYSQISIVGPDRNYTYTNQVLPDGRTFIVQVDELVMARPFLVGYPDPRQIGMHPGSYNANPTTKYDHYLGGSPRDNLVWTRESWEGVECDVARCDMPEPGGQVEVWISPDEGPSVRRCSLSWMDQGVQMVSDATTEVKYYPEADSWMPLHFHHTRRADNQLTTVEDVDVNIRSLNQPVPKELLEIASMNVPPGTGAGFAPSREGEWQWNGKDFERVDVLTAGVAPFASARLLVIVAVNLLVLSIIAFAVGYRRRTSRSE